MAETAPLRWLYRRGRFVTVSEATARQLMELGIPREAIEVNYHGPEPDEYGPGTRATEPTLIYLGRLKRYKRIEVLLDVVEGAPGAVLDIVGTGEHRPVLEAQIAARGLQDRVRLHGFVDHERKVELLRRSLGTGDRLGGGGMGPDHARGRGVRHSERRARGWAVWPRRSSTSAPACSPGTRPTWSCRRGGSWATPSCVSGWAPMRLRRAHELGWRHTVGRTLAVLEEQLGRAPSRRPVAPASLQDVAPAVADAEARSADASSAEGE